MNCPMYFATLNEMSQVFEDEKVSICGYSIYDNPVHTGFQSPVYFRNSESLVIYYMDYLKYSRTDISIHASLHGDLLFFTHKPGYPISREA
jgi:hypothetical protein